MTKNINYNKFLKLQYMTTIKTAINPTYNPVQIKGEKNTNFEIVIAWKRELA